MTFLGWQNEWGLFFAPKWNNEFCVWHSNKRGVCDWKRSNWENIEARLSSSENEVTSSKPLKSFISSTLNLNYLIFCCLFGLFNATETPFSSPLYLQHKRKWQNPMCIFQLFWFCCCFCYSVGGFLSVEKKHRGICTRSRARQFEIMDFRCWIQAIWFLCHLRSTKNPKLC